MFELMILLSRFVFLFLIGIFIFQLILSVAIDQGISDKNMALTASKQRLCILFQHLMGILILSYQSNEFSFAWETLTFGFAVFIFLLVFMFFITKIYQYSSEVMWNCVIFLLDIGILVLYRLNKEQAMKQFFFILFSFVLLVIFPLLMKIIGRILKIPSLLMVLSFLLLLLPSVFGQEQFGAKNWIKINEFISFQPSEAVKILFVLYLSESFSRSCDFKKIMRTGLMSFLLILILVMQKDLGGALLFFIIYMLMMYLASESEILFFGGLGAGLVASFFASAIFPHVKTRVAAWQNPVKNIHKGGYQILQSLFAISYWGIFGAGFTRGYPLYMPVVTKDLIFSAIVEEFGIIYGIGMMIMYLYILYRGFRLAMRSKDVFLSFLCAGMSSILLFQCFLIVGGVTKLIPLTGVTLPFVSYGGSSLLVSLLMVALIEWAAKPIALQRGES